MKTATKKVLSFSALLALCMSTLVMTTSAANLTSEQTVQAKDYIQVDVKATADTRKDQDWVVGMYRLGDPKYTTPETGDVYLEYSVQILNEVVGIGHIDFFTGGAWWLDLNAPAADQNGVLAGRVDLSEVAYGKWYSRKIKMENNKKLDPMFASAWIPGGALKKDEVVTMLFKDIRFVDGSGKVLFNFFKDYMDRDHTGDIDTFDMSMTSGFGLNATAQGYYVKAVQYEPGKAIDVELPVDKEALYGTVYAVEKKAANGEAAVAKKKTETPASGLDTLTYTPKADYKGYDEVILAPKYVKPDDAEQVVGSGSATGSTLKYKFVFYAKAEGGSTGGDNKPPQTSDNTPFMVVLPLLMLSSAVLTVLAVKRKDSAR